MAAKPTKGRGAKDADGFTSPLQEHLPKEHAKAAGKGQRQDAGKDKKK